MIRMDNELLWPEVVLPSPKATDECVELLIICGIVQGSSTQLLAEVGDRTPFLEKHTTNAEVGGVTLDFEGLLEVRKL